MFFVFLYKQDCAFFWTRSLQNFLKVTYIYFTWQKCARHVKYLWVLPHESHNTLYVESTEWSHDKAIVFV